MLQQILSYEYALIDDKHKIHLTETPSKMLKNVNYIKYDGEVILALGDDTTASDAHLLAYWLNNDNQYTDKLTRNAKIMLETENA